MVITNFKKIKQYILDNLLSFLMITLGVILISIALDTILIPNGIVDGGLIGFSIIVSQILNIKLGILVVLINIPFFIFGYKQLGKLFLVKAIYAMIIFSYFLSYFESLDTFTNDILSTVVFGGALLGIGVGIVLKYGACVDGADIIAIYFSKKSSFSNGQIIIFLNVFIYLFAGFYFGWDRAMHSLITYFFSFKMIDFIDEGLEQAKEVRIITTNGENISKNIYDKLGRTVTILEGEGFISNSKKMVLYTVISKLEIPELKRIVKEDDNSAFVVISDVSEIYGKHIKNNEKDM